MSDCIFCEIIAKRAPAAIVYEDELVLSFMDLFPLTKGHVLVIPKQHKVFLNELDEEYRQALFVASNKILRAVRDCPEVGCDGVHILINDGKAANQTVPHVHCHLIPRRNSDGVKQLLALPFRNIPYKMQTRRERLQSLASAINAQL